MADDTVSQLTPVVKENPLNFIEENGQILLSAEEIGRHLGYKQPAKAINRIFNRKQKELMGYAVGVKLTSTDGKLYTVRHFSEEGVYILSMLADTPMAADFRARLARLLRELRERRLALAREAGYAQGRDEALSLPAVQAERKAGYLEGMKEGARLQKRRDGLTLLLKIRGYRARGLTLTETGKLLGMSKHAVDQRLRRARKNGLLTEGA